MANYIDIKTISSAVTTVANMTALVALTGMTSGDQAFVTANNKLFLYNGSGWYLVATVQNSSPSAITGVDGTYALATDGTATTITAVSTDPEGVPLTWSYAVTTGSLTNGGGASATVSQADNVFTITPSTNTAYAGTFTLTFSATDGVTGAVSAVSAFTLAFSADWSSVSQQAKLVGSLSSDWDNFGHDVSISDDGNTLVVAAQYEDEGANGTGAAFVFVRSGSTWSEQAILLSGEAEAGDFMSAAAISGDGNTILTGARGEDSSGSGAGAAYIFTRSGTTWTEQTELRGTDTSANDFFGYSVDLSDNGNSAIVSTFDQNSGHNGEAYIFTRSGTTWSQQAKLTASDGSGADYFGFHCAIDADGDTAIVGAYSQDTGGAEAGAAYIFTRSGTTWSQQAKIQASNKGASDEFGQSVDISNDGNTVIVGARKEDTGGSDRGSAYVFTRSGTNWSQQQQIQSSDIADADWFGYSVALGGDSGDIAIVGAVYEDTDYDNAGAIYIFTRSGTTWTQQSKSTPTDSDRASNDQFGAFVDICDDTAVGTTYRTTTTDKGAAYIFTAS